MTAGSERFELCVYSARGVTTYDLPPGKSLVLGRGDDVDIRVEDVAVSRRHAIFHAGPPVEVEDLASANGTFVSRASVGASAARAETADRKRVLEKRAQLEVGDSVFFGAAVVVVREAKPAPQVAPPASSSKWDSDSSVVRSSALVRVYDEAARAAPMSLPILIVGETGVGKDVMARFVHDRSPRAKKPFVALNCAALSETLADSQLFGHERGAFTGAQQTTAGLFETANGGTVFLDEVGELPLTTQAKLLRTLENSEVQRLGSMKAIQVDVRVVSATNRDLEKAIAQGSFRSDLYFRLNGITLRIPPLRERKGEIAELARRFLQAACNQAGFAARPEISRAALDALEAYAWPGNVRELRYMMERTLVTAGDGPIGVEHLPPALAGGDVPSNRADASTREPLATKERVVEALAKCDGNQTQAAELLGVSRRTLINRMIAFGLPRPRKG